MRFQLLIGWFAIAATVSCQSQSQTRAGKMLIVLGGSTDECIGCSWPKDDEKVTNQIGIETPTDVSIRYGQDKILTTYSKVTFIEEKEGVVRKVTVSPLANLVNYQDALRSVKEFLGKLPLDSDDALEAKLEKLQQSTPSNDPFATKTFKQVVDAPVEIFVEIKPHPSGAGWFANISMMDVSRYDIE